VEITFAAPTSKNKNMKKSLLPILFFFTSFNFIAQSGLSNLSFESWTSIGVVEIPTGFIGTGLSKQNSGAQQGTYFVRISNSVNYQGILMLGSPSANPNVKIGVPYTQNPTSISGFYRTSGLVAGDVVGLTAFTTKSGWGSALASFSQTANVANWTSFSASFFVLGTAVDSLFVAASSGNIFGGNNNSLSAVLDLDNLALAITVGIDERSVGTAFLVYPNPASSEVNVILKDENASFLKITDMNGRVIKEQELNRGQTKIDLRNYERGIYFYSRLDGDKSIIFTSKLIISE